MSEDKTKASAHTSFAAYIESRGLRKTPERFHILYQIMDMSGPFEADDLMRLFEQEAYRVSRATVYNTLSLLSDCGLIRRCPRTGTRIRYERVSAVASRFQLVCSQCGKIKELKDADLFRQINAKRYSAFHAAGFTLTVNGICSRCMRQNKKKSIITTNTESTVLRKKQ